MKQTETYYSKMIEEYIYYFSKLSPTLFDKLTKEMPVKEKNSFKNFYFPITTSHIFKTIGKDVPDSLNKNSVLRYRYKKKYADLLTSPPSTSNLSMFFPLISAIKANHTFENTLKPNLSPGLYKAKMNNISMGGVSFFNEKSPGPKTKNFKELKEFLPDIEVIVPTEVSKKDELYRLRIPKKLAEAFQIDENTKYYLGLQEDSYATLFLFPKRKDNKNQIINTLNPEIFETSNDYSDANLFNLDVYNINILSRKIETIYRSGDYLYLNLPQEMLRISDVEGWNIPNEAKVPLTPAFTIMYDLCGNLIFNRIIYSPKEEIKNDPIPAFFLSELNKHS
ncbi:MAG: hypothetical protein K9L24_03465 [Spirochaetia bacterium]|nr:hypothetical protein [Spirochaetia bacterium]MCF7945892.1 hypothetical protein [Spirochaetia bacterium]